MLSFSVHLLVLLRFVALTLTLTLSQCAQLHMHATQGVLRVALFTNALALAFGHGCAM
jgi:hypothetical protein